MLSMSIQQCWVHSTAYIVEAKLKRPKAASPSNVIMLSLSQLLKGPLIVTGLFMGEIFDFIQVLKVQAKSRKRSDYVIDRKSTT